MANPSEVTNILIFSDFVIIMYFYFAILFISCIIGVHMSLKDILAYMEMAQEDLPMESVTSKVDPIEENAHVVDHKLIREATDGVISIIAGGLVRLKDVLAIQKVRELLLLLRRPMEGIVQQYQIGEITTLEGPLKDWVHKSSQADKA